MGTQDAESVALVFFNRKICQHEDFETIYGHQGTNFADRIPRTCTLLSVILMSILIVVLAQCYAGIHKPL